jgi:hypothetical protein
MSSAASSLVNKVWNYCNLLRDDGVSYGDYVEQLTYLLFLKMEYERTRPPYNKMSTIPKEYNWFCLIELDGLPLERHYRNTLDNLGKEPGILGIIFRKLRTRFRLQPTCAASSSISSIRNRGAHLPPTSRVTSTKDYSKRTRRIRSPARVSTSRRAF